MTTILQAKITYEFSAKLWKSDGHGGWWFVSLPSDMSTEIRENLQWQEEGWGRLKATAIVGKLEWDTAIWFDSKSGVYLLPMKADIRKQAKIELGEEVAVRILV